MSRIPGFVGVDYHQASVQVLVIDGPGREFGNPRCTSESGAVIGFVGRYRRALRAYYCVACRICQLPAGPVTKRVETHPINLIHCGFVSW